MLNISVKNNTKILVTGGCGFIGSHFIKHILNTTDFDVINIDNLTYAGNLDNLSDIIDTDRYTFVKTDISDEDKMDRIFYLNDITYVANFAADSHVDRSIKNPNIFANTNIIGTTTLLNLAKEYKIKRYLQVSTDEVYGMLPLNSSEKFTENTPLQPSSPYSASKAAADLLVLANYHTYGQDVVVTRCSNNYGTHQYPEKLIPVIITKAVQNLPIPVYGNGLNVRDWIHVEDHCKGILKALLNGEAGEVYNFGGNCELTNIDVVKCILDIVKMPHSLINYVKDRPGHDLRYAIDYSKAKQKLGWEPKTLWTDGIRKTVDWYANCWM